MASRCGLTSGKYRYATIIVQPKRCRVQLLNESDSLTIARRVEKVPLSAGLFASLPRL